MIVVTVSANPGEITVAKAIERYFNVALYLLVLSGFGALASTGGLDLPAPGLVGLALAIRGFQLLTGREFAIPKRWTTVLTLIYQAGRRETRHRPSVTSLNPQAGHLL